MPAFVRFLCILLAAVALTQCSAPISVQEVRPDKQFVARSASLANLIDEVRAALKRVEPGDAAAVSDYNDRLSRLLEKLNQSGGSVQGTRLVVNSPGGVRDLRIKAPDSFHPPHAQLLPVDTLEFSGDYAGYQSKVAGIGAPVVAVKSVDQIGFITARKTQPLRNLTALIRFRGNSATLELVDPYQVERVSIAGKRQRLAADYGATMMYGLSKARIDKLGLARLLNPQKFSNTSHLNFLQPYDPKRIPVLMVHGLDSTPATWAPAYFKMLEDEEIREAYQFWVFSYPSGYPYPYSASLLRKRLEDVQQEFPDHKDIVIVGHSMGSLITRLMITDVGDKIWVKTFGKPPAETRISGKSRQLLEDSVIFNHVPTIDRAIMVSGPHRGSEGADNPIVRLLNRLVKLPGFMADVRNAAASVATADTAAFALKRAPSSVDTLSPNNPFVKEINRHPIRADIPYHSIMGDRGKGDTPDSSDGIVAYWSSYLDGARSNKIVPSGHSAHHHPVGIEEIERILKLHLKESR